MHVTLKKIANRVYANRMGNGDENSGDGYKYSGKGYIQLTGKSNYTILNKLITENIVEKPNLVATKYPMMSAAFFFNNNLWTMCDKGATTDVVTMVTKRVNGGTNGLKDRIEKFNKFYNKLME